MTALFPRVLGASWINRSPPAVRAPVNPYQFCITEVLSKFQLESASDPDALRAVIANMRRNLASAVSNFFFATDYDGVFVWSMQTKCEKCMVTDECMFEIRLILEPADYKQAGMNYSLPTGSVWDRFNTIGNGERLEVLAGHLSQTADSVEPFVSTAVLMPAYYIAPKIYMIEGSEFCTLTAGDIAKIRQGALFSSIEDVCNLLLWANPLFPPSGLLPDRRHVAAVLALKTLIFCQSNWVSNPHGSVVLIVPTVVFNSIQCSSVPGFSGATAMVHPAAARYAGLAEFCDNIHPTLARVLKRMAPSSSRMTKDALNVIIKVTRRDLLGLFKAVD